MRWFPRPRGDGPAASSTFTALMMVPPPTRGWSPDSLSGRLEYVPGSSRGDRPTVFTLQANEAGSASGFLRAMRCVRPRIDHQENSQASSEGKYGRDKETAIPRRMRIHDRSS